MSNPNIEKAKNEISKLMDYDDDDDDDVSNKNNINKPNKNIIISPTKPLNDMGNTLQNERVIAPLEPMNFPNMTSEFKDGVLAKFLIDGIVKEYISDDLKSVKESENIV